MCERETSPVDRGRRVGEGVRRLRNCESQTEEHEKQEREECKAGHGEFVRLLVVVSIRYVK